MSITIKEASRKDLKGVSELAIKLAQYESHFDKRIKIDEKTKKLYFPWYQKLIKNKKWVIFMAKKNNIIVGFATGCIDDENKEFYKYNIGYLSDCYVDKEYRKEGIGKRFTQRLIKWFKKKGINDLHLDVYYENPARKLWKKLGFNTISERRSMSV